MSSGSTSGRHSFKLRFGRKLQRGGDAINPHVGQRGSLAKRQEAVKNGFFVLLCAQLLEEVEDRIFSYAAASTLWRRRSNPARPYMDRLMAFNRLICPSTGPVLQGSVKAACTASRS
jgi:hypothetical protein